MRTTPSDVAGSTVGETNAMVPCQGLARHGVEPDSTSAPSRRRTRSGAEASARSSRDAVSAISATGVAGVPFTSSPVRRNTRTTTPAIGAVTRARPRWRSARWLRACAASSSAAAASRRACASSTSRRGAIPLLTSRRARESAASALTSAARAEASPAPPSPTAAARAGSSTTASGSPARTRSPSRALTSIRRPATAGATTASRSAAR